MDLGPGERWIQTQVPSRVTTKTYNVAISACGKSERWQEAVWLLQALPHAALEADVVTYNAAIAACGRGRQWARAIALLELAQLKAEADAIGYGAAIAACEWTLALALLAQMARRHVECSVIAQNSGISVCAQAAQWQRALLLLFGMHEQCLQSTVVSFNAAMAACAREWWQAMCVLQALPLRGLLPDVISYNAGINACEAQNGWQMALGLCRNLEESLLQRNVVTFGSMISSFAKNSQWQQALDCLRELKMSALQENLIAYNAAISACEHMQLWQAAVHLLQEAQASAITPDIISFNCALSACSEDLPAARRLLSALRFAGLQETPVTGHAVMRALGSASQWEEALAHLARLADPDLISFHCAAAAACGTAHAWQRALQVLSSARLASFHWDSVTYTTAMIAFEKGGQWQKALLLFEEAVTRTRCDLVIYNAAMSAGPWQHCLLLLHDLQLRKLRANAVTFGAVVSACRNSGQWTWALHVLDVARRQLAANSVVTNAAVNACGRAEQWQRGMQLLGPDADLAAYDCLLAATAGCGRRDQAVRLLWRSAHLRTAASFLWALATLGCEDPEVIAAALDLDSDSDPRLLWSLATLGVEHPKQRSLYAQFLRTIDGRSLEEILLAASHCDAQLEAAHFDGLQEAVLLKLPELGLAVRSRLAFPDLGISLLGILAACRLSGFLRQRLLHAATTALRRVGRRMDGPPQEAPLQASGGTDSPLVLDQRDCLVLQKPSGWETYGGHTKRQLSSFVVQSFGAAIFQDLAHNCGFLHRLDVPSSGLIIVAKTYESFYHLQVQLHAGLLTREYLALAHGEAGFRGRGLRSRLQPRSQGPTLAGGRGKWSETRVQVLSLLYGEVGAFSYLLLRLVTGRKHQIRSQLAFVGHPLCRDGLYTGSATFRGDKAVASRNWLHRHRLAFTDGGCELHAEGRSCFDASCRQLRNRTR
ncbi:unnamed protein product [Effrenium voratum]|uniref:Pseudouridine synthase RsuA/RluA-like domain-containing protein n=1 Tax=Effrenium voratum TaxID=2562239 RepID=A0AA36I0R2_9DINO|nr:unnamed protein product [Effrenium voratum]